MREDGIAQAAANPPIDRTVTQQPAAMLRVRGDRMGEILKQRQVKPMNVIDQVMIIFAGSKGYLDKVDRKIVLKWEEQFLLFMKEQKADVRNELVKSKKLTPAIEDGLKKALDIFQQQFKV